MIDTSAETIRLIVNRNWHKTDYIRSWTDGILKGGVNEDDAAWPLTQFVLRVTKKFTWRERFIIFFTGRLPKELPPLIDHSTDQEEN